jgi:rubrerythrin
MTTENLKAAFAGESQAHMKYLAFADKAEKEGQPDVARLFKAIAYAEQVHATNHFRALEGINSTVENLNAAIAGETFELKQMYPPYRAVATLQHDNRAETPMHYALETEKVHAKLYSTVKESVASGTKPSIGTISVCPVCGFTIEGSLPDHCPVCNTPKDKFKSFA